MKEPRFTFDAQGRRVFETWADAMVATLDPIPKAAPEAWPEPTGFTIDMEYDAKGRLVVGPKMPIYRDE